MALSARDKGAGAGAGAGGSAEGASPGMADGAGGEEVSIAVVSAVAVVGFSGILMIQNLN